MIVLGWAHVSGWDLECSSSFELGHERMFDGCSMSERPWSSDHSQSPDLDETCTGMAVHSGHTSLGSTDVPELGDLAVQ